MPAAGSQTFFRHRSAMRPLLARHVVRAAQGISDLVAILDPVVFGAQIVLGITRSGAKVWEEAKSINRNMKGSTLCNSWRDTKAIQGSDASKTALLGLSKMRSFTSLASWEPRRAKVRFLKIDRIGSRGQIWMHLAPTVSIDFITTGIQKFDVEDRTKKGTVYLSAYICIWVCMFFWGQWTIKPFTIASVMWPSIKPPCHMRGDQSTAAANPPSKCPPTRWRSSHPPGVSTSAVCDTSEDERSVEYQKYPTETLEQVDLI